MGIPGIFVGAPYRFMDGELPAYAVAKKNNRACQFGLDTTRQFCLRFPFTLAKGEEPMAEALMLVNNDASTNIPEMPFPDAQKLTPQAFVAAMMAYTSYNEKVKECEGVSRVDLVILINLIMLLCFCQHIDRWLRYHHEKSLKPMVKDDPYCHVLAKLAGVQASKPHRQTAYNLWCELYGNEVEEELVKLIQEGKVMQKQKPGKHQTMQSDMYTNLSEEEKCEWMRRSEEEHNIAMAEWKVGIDGAVSDDPHEIQQ